MLYSYFSLLVKQQPVNLSPIFMLAIHLLLANFKATACKFESYFLLLANLKQQPALFSC